MAKTIPQLTDATTVNAADELIIQQGGITKRATAAELMNNAPVTAAGTTTPRALADRFASVVNVADFGAVGDGVTDDKAAFEAARDSVPTGSRVKIVIPGADGGGNRSYVISSAIATNGRVVSWEFEPGATVVGDIRQLLTWPTRFADTRISGVSRKYSSQAPDASLGDVSHELVEMGRGGSTAAGYGIRWNYSSTFFGSGFDLAHGIVAVWNRSAGQDGGTGFASWLVAISPLVGGPTTRSATCVAEWNVVNRHADSGWSKRRSTLPNWCGIHQIVPEGKTFGLPGQAFDILFGTVYTRSSSLKNDGFPARFHNAILLEPNSLTASGRFIYASGRDSLFDASQTPVAVIEADDDWQRGFSTRRAAFTTSVAYGMGGSHVVAWLDGSDNILNGIYSGAGSPESVVAAPTGSMFLRRDGGAGTTLYIKESGSGNTGWVAK
jgi:hypothetical protein